VTGGRRPVSIESDAGRRTKIFDSVGSSPLEDWLEPGTIPGCGTYFCLGCGVQLSLRETDELPDCPACGGTRFRRDSMFKSRQDHGLSTAELPLPGERAVPDWLPQARQSLSQPGDHLAMKEDGGSISTFRVERGWTRIGRSERANLRLDDPTVSRRHAMIVADPRKPLRVLDDRSLNGVFVNGASVEWALLRDGDELGVGRYLLYALRCEAPGSGHPRP